jgi:hypothetical protein
MSAKQSRKGQEPKHLSWDSYFKQTLTKRKLKMEEEGNTKSVPKKKQSRAPDVKGVFPDLHEN